MGPRGKLAEHVGKLKQDALAVKWFVKKAE